jgi:hypothetical protein
MAVLAHERRWLAAANKIATTFAVSFYLQPDAPALRQLVGRNCEYEVNSLARLNVHGSLFLGCRRCLARRTPLLLLAELRTELSRISVGL